MRMSGSSVIPAGSKRMLVNFETNVSSGTPYCSPIEMAMENASITPASVEPCLDIFRKTSPSPSSGYDDAVRYPSAPPTENDTVSDGRFFGSRLRTGRYSMIFSGSGAFSTAAPSFLGFALDSGWPTLQLSREIDSG